MNEKLIKGLEAALEFVKDNRDFDFECGGPELVELHYRTWYLYGYSNEGKRAKVVDLMKRLSGGKKQYHYEFFRFTHLFSPVVRFVVHAERENICERVKVGQEIIPEHVLPAQEEIVVPACIEEKYEWRCNPLLSDEEESTMTSA